MYISTQYSVYQLLDGLSPEAFVVTHKKKSRTARRAWPKMDEEGS
jgi:hypothetical protein